MNFHPLIVHFPIALLTFYSLAEILRFRWFVDRPWWFPLKAFLVIVGFLAAGAAYISGDLAGGGFQNDPQLSAVVEAHELWAKITLGIYGIIGAAYFIVFLTREGFMLFPSMFVASLSRVLDNRFMSVLALLALSAITITGGLGGSITYGPRIDPFIPIIYAVLGLPL